MQSIILLPPQSGEGNLKPWQAAGCAMTNSKVLSAALPDQVPLPVMWMCLFCAFVFCVRVSVSVRRFPVSHTHSQKHK